MNDKNSAGITYDNIKLIEALIVLECRYARICYDPEGVDIEEYKSLRKSINSIRAELDMTLNPTWKE